MKMLKSVVKSKYRYMKMLKSVLKTLIRETNIEALNWKVVNSTFKSLKIVVSITKL